MPVQGATTNLLIDRKRYALNEARAAVTARLQSFHLVYRRRFDVGTNPTDNSHYTPKLGYDSTHTAALAELFGKETVIDIGCGPCYFALSIAAKGCRVIGIDRCRPIHNSWFNQFIECDLDDSKLPRLDNADVTLCLT